MRKRKLPPNYLRCTNNECSLRRSCLRYLDRNFKNEFVANYKPGNKIKCELYILKNND